MHKLLFTYHTIIILEPLVLFEQQHGKSVCVTVCHLKMQLRLLELKGGQVTLGAN